MERIEFCHNISAKVLFSLEEIQKFHNLVLLDASDNSYRDRLIPMFVAAEMVCKEQTSKGDQTGEAPCILNCEKLNYLLGLLESEDELVEDLGEILGETSHEVVVHNRLNPWKSKQPWYCKPLQEIAESLWWDCIVGVDLKGNLAISTNDSVLFACKFLPRCGTRTNVFKVVANQWPNGGDSQIWQNFQIGNVCELKDLIQAFDATRSLHNSRFKTWDDDTKCFIPSPQGEILVPRMDEHG